MEDMGSKRASGMDEVVAEVTGASSGTQQQRYVNTSLSLLHGQWLENIFQQNWESI